MNIPLYDIYNIEAKSLKINRFKSKNTGKRIAQMVFYDGENPSMSKPIATIPFTPQELLDFIALLKSFEDKNGDFFEDTKLSQLLYEPFSPEDFSS